MYLYKQLVILATIFLSSCGFHFQKNYNLTKSISAINISGLNSHDQLLIALQNKLMQQKINLNDTAKTILEINSQNITEQTIAINSKGQPIKIAYILNISYSFTYNNQTYTNTIMVMHHLNINPNLPLSNEYEQNMYLKSMYEKAASKLIYQIEKNL